MPREIRCEKIGLRSHLGERIAGNGAHVLGAAWLLFFPNAPYIFTDLIHLTAQFYGHFWADILVILLCSLTGLVLGFVSLFLVQSVVEVELEQFCLAALSQGDGFKVSPWCLATGPRCAGRAGARRPRRGRTP